MEIIMPPLRLQNAVTGGEFIEIEGKVDTGATMLVLPGKIAEQLIAWQAAAKHGAGQIAANRIACGLDGKWFAIALRDAKNGGAIHVFPPEGKPFFLRGHTRPVLDVCFTPDGKLISSGSDGTVRRWDLNPKEPAK
jgi:WD domain, G-beta repeat